LQIVENKSYDSSVDWFSFGVVLFEMLAGRLPFDGFDEEEMFHRIVHSQPKYPKHLKTEAIACIHLVRIIASVIEIFNLILSRYILLKNLSTYKGDGIETILVERRACQ
jgi:serine/threonine protein kinase